MTDLVISLILAVGFTMVVESPFVRLERLLLRGGEKKNESLLEKDSIITTNNAK